MIKKQIIGILGFLFVSYLYPETVILKNKTVIKGKIIKQTRTEVMIKTSENKQIIIQKSKIQKIIYEEDPLKKESQTLNKEKKNQIELVEDQELKQKLEEQKIKKIIELKDKNNVLKKQEVNNNISDQIVPISFYQWGYSLLFGYNYNTSIIDSITKNFTQILSRSFLLKNSIFPFINIDSKIKNSYTINIETFYKNHYFIIGLDFYSIHTASLLYNSYFVNVWNPAGNINFYGIPIENHLKPYKQLHYRFFIDLEPYLYYSMILKKPYINKNFKFYLELSFLNHYYSTDFNQKTMKVWDPSFDISALNFDNNIFAIENLHFKMRIKEDGFLWGFRWNLEGKFYNIDFSLKQIQANSYIKYNSDNLPVFYRLNPEQNIEFIRRKAKVNGLEYLISFKRNIYSHLFIIFKIRHANFNYHLKSFNRNEVKLFNNNLNIDYLDNSKFNFIFRLVDEKKFSYQNTDFLLGIQQIFNL